MTRIHRNGFLGKSNDDAACLQMSDNNVDKYLTPRLTSSVSVITRKEIFDRDLLHAYH